VLHQFDKFVEKKRNEMVGSAVPTYYSNPEYDRISNRISKLNKLGIRSKEKRSLIKERLYIKSRVVDPNYINFKYVRYADDWIVGIWGPRTLAQSLKSEFGSYLKSLKLELSLEKTLITNASRGKALFLGTLISVTDSTRSPVVRVPDKKGKLRRIPDGIVQLNAPLNRLFDRLREKGFLDKNTDRFIPLGIPKFLALRPKELVIRYKTILYGFLNYYSFADNRSHLGSLYYILRGSLIMTLRRKFDAGYREILRRFGKNVSVLIRRPNGNIVSLSFDCPNLRRNSMNFLGAKKFTDPLSIKD